MKDIDKINLSELFNKTGKKKIWVASELKCHPSYVTIAIKATGDKLKEPAIQRMRKNIYKLLNEGKL